VLKKAAIHWPAGHYEVCPERCLCRPKPPLVRVDIHCWAVGEVRLHRCLERSLACGVSLPDYAAIWSLFTLRLTRDGPNQKWAGDISYIWTNEGRLYLAVILDLYSRRVIGWAVSNRRSGIGPLLCVSHPKAAFTIRIADRNTVQITTKSF
jgi:hypothetical protein